MVSGINSFKEWFAGYSDQYVIIGGTACDLLMSREDFDFRATKDIDMVLILESLTPAFGVRFWEYVHMAGYEHRNKSTGEPQFYRFVKPMDSRYPYMIELFSRRSDAVYLPENAVLTPLPLDEEISSLSAILMDEEYYQFLLRGKEMVDGLPVLGAEYLIPFKARAYLDLMGRRESGGAVDSRDIRKHKNDVIRLSMLLLPETRIPVTAGIHKDLIAYLKEMENTEVDMKQLGIRNQSLEEVLRKIESTYHI